jgi:adenylate kinase
MIGLIEDCFSKLQGNANVLLDGFPRTVPQAEALDTKDLTQVNLALYFDLPDSELIERLTGRRTCKKCGEPYHVKFLPPKQEGSCDRCGGELMQRSDDTEEVAKRRLQVFHTQNEGILKYYRQKDNLKEINANRSRDEIQDDLVKTLKA